MGYDTHSPFPQTTIALNPIYANDKSRVEYPYHITVTSRCLLNALGIMIYYVSLPEICCAPSTIM